MRAIAMWRTVVIYGVGIALAAVAIEQLKFRHAASEVSTDLYVGLLAVGFTALGHRLTARKPPGPFERNLAAINALELTRRECQILELLASGQSNKELARSLGRRG